MCSSWSLAPAASAAAACGQNANESRHGNWIRNAASASASAAAAADVLRATLTNLIDDFHCQSSSSSLSSLVKGVIVVVAQLLLPPLLPPKCIHYLQ